MQQRSRPTLAFQLLSLKFLKSLSSVQILQPLETDISRSLRSFSFTTTSAVPPPLLLLLLSCCFIFIQQTSVVAIVAQIFLPSHQNKKSPIAKSLQTKKDSQTNRPATQTVQESRPEKPILGNISAASMT